MNLREVKNSITVLYQNLAYYSPLPKTCITFFAYSTVVKQENTAEKSEQW